MTQQQIQTRLSLESGTKLSKELGVNKSSISSWANGKPMTKTVQAMFRYYFMYQDVTVLSRKRFGDIPMSVFYKAMEEYAQKAKKLHIHGVSEIEEEDTEFCPHCGSADIHCEGGEFNEWFCDTCDRYFPFPNTK